MNDKFDVLVIGGGPAGMSAAIFAAQNAEVLLIEKNEKLRLVYIFVTYYTEYKKKLVKRTKFYQ